MKNYETKIKPGEIKEINGEEYFDANAVYFMSLAVLADPSATDEVVKNAKKLIKFVTDNGYLKMEVVEKKEEVLFL
ncbi:MAG: hypothetical protein FWC41_02540 [Firmicutes bacterium]|nr:hypothetical protein [Bacillota bacterium]